MILQPREKRQRRLRRVAVLPALATLMNGVFGFAAITFTARGDGFWLEKPPLTFFAAAAYMIFFAMLMDALDGWLARMSRSSSSFGGQLDSLSDVISFGVAPAFLMLRVVDLKLHEKIGLAGPALASPLGKLLWLSAAVYFCCTALRLARFNVENSPEESSHLMFSGLPSPAAAGVIASLVLLYSDMLRDLENILTFWTSQAIIYALPFITVGVALLMVSRVPYRHVVNQYVRGKRPFLHVVVIVIVLLLLIWNMQLILAAGFLFFALSGLIKWLIRRRRHAPATLPEPPVETT